MQTTLVGGMHPMDIRNLPLNFWIYGLCAELHGPGRVAGLRRWVSIMQALSTPRLQPLYTSTVSSSEGDWQTLTQVKPER